MIKRDPHGVFANGSDLSRDRWPAERRAATLETSVPGVFAAGDVRSGSIKRVAAAVGEGAAAVPMIHSYLERR